MFHVKHKIITIHNEAVTMATGMIRKKSIVELFETTIIQKDFFDSGYVPHFSNVECTFKFAVF